MADRDPIIEEIIDSLKERITFADGVEFSLPFDKDYYKNFLPNSLKRVLGWKSSRSNASKKATELFRLLLRDGAFSLKKAEFVIKFTKDRIGMPLNLGGDADGHVENGKVDKVIWVNTTSNVTPAVQIFIHELTHFSLLRIFMNNFCPYTAHLETSKEEQEQMVGYTNMVRPNLDGWDTIKSKLSSNVVFCEGTGVRSSPKSCLIGTHNSLTCSKTDFELLLEAIPHMIEMIFNLTDFDLNYEEIFSYAPSISAAVEFFVGTLSRKLVERRKVIFRDDWI